MRDVEVGWSEGCVVVVEVEVWLWQQQAVGVV